MMKPPYITENKRAIVFNHKEEAEQELAIMKQVVKDNGYFTLYNLWHLRGSGEVDVTIDKTIYWDDMSDAVIVEVREGFILIMPEHKISDRPLSDDGHEIPYISDDNRNVFVNTREEADSFISDVRKLILTQRRVTLADVKDILNLPCVFAETLVYWDNINKFDIVKHPFGYKVRIMSTAKVNPISHKYLGVTRREKQEEPRKKHVYNVSWSMYIENDLSRLAARGDLTYEDFETIDNVERADRIKDTIRKSIIEREKYEKLKGKFIIIDSFSKIH